VRAANADTPHNSMKSHTQLRRLLLTAAAILGAWLVFVDMSPSVLAPFPRVQAAPALATAADRSFPVLASASGVLQPGQLENLNFTIAGQVQTITTQVGAKVTAGEILAKLNDRSQQAELNAAIDAVIAAQGRVCLDDSGPGLGKAGCSIQAWLANAEVGLVRAQQNEAATVLYAPEAGTILQVNGVVGDTVSAGNSGPTNPATNGGSASTNGFIVIGNDSSFVFRAPFSQAEGVQLVAGQSATVTVDLLPGLSLPAKISSIETSATQVGGVPEYYAEVTLGASDPRLRKGMTGSVDVTIASANNVLAVPSAALFTGASGALQVDVWSGGQAHATTVQIGLVGKNLTQITSGLQAGEQVMLSPAGQTLPSSPSPT
jgi:membrane fusion protein, macrolide-specific efflux system